MKALAFLLLFSACEYNIREGSIVDPIEPDAARTAVAFWNAADRTDILVEQGGCSRPVCVRVETGRCPSDDAGACANADARGVFIRLTEKGLASPDLAILYAHEIGHLLGYVHSETGVMCEVSSCMTWELVQ